MTTPSSHSCNKEKEIATLIANYNNMAEIIKDFIKESKDFNAEIMKKIDLFSTTFVTKAEYAEGKSRMLRLELAMVTVLFCFAGYLIVMAGDKIFK